MRDEVREGFSFPLLDLFCSAAGVYSGLGVETEEKVGGRERQIQGRTNHSPHPTTPIPSPTNRCLHACAHIHAHLSAPRSSKPTGFNRHVIRQR